MDHNTKLIDKVNGCLENSTLMDQEMKQLFLDIKKELETNSVETDKEVPKPVWCDNADYCDCLRTCGN